MIKCCGFTQNIRFSPLFAAKGEALKNKKRGSVLKAILLLEHFAEVNFAPLGIFQLPTIYKRTKLAGFVEPGVHLRLRP